MSPSVQSCSRHLSRANKVSRQLRIREEVQVDIAGQDIADDVTFRTLVPRQRRSHAIDTLDIRGARFDRGVVKTMAASCRAGSTEQAVCRENPLCVAETPQPVR